MNRTISVDNTSLVFPANWVAGDTSNQEKFTVLIEIVCERVEQQLGHLQPTQFLAMGAVGKGIVEIGGDAAHDECVDIVQQAVGAAE